MRCPYPIGLLNPNAKALGLPLRMNVGCGKCGACRHNKRTEWTIRITQEERHSTSAEFVTLTYAPVTVPMTENGYLTLNYHDVQKFLKRIRKAQSRTTEEKVRFFCVGEYGSKFARPHYHIIFFNLHPFYSDLEYLQHEWQKGLVHSIPLEEGLSHYACKYHVTVNRERHLDPNDDRVNEFSTASMKPGLGYQYVDRCKDYHIRNMESTMRVNGYKLSLPKYYKDKIFGEQSEEYKKELYFKNIGKLERYEEKLKEKLLSEGYKNPEKEMLERAYRASREVVFKSKKSGIF